MAGLSSQNKFDISYYHQKFYQGRFITRGDKPFIYQYWINYFRKVKPYKSLFLDIGCGEGYLCKRASIFFKTYGLDISFDAIGLAKSHSDNTSYLTGSVENGLSFKSNLFDIIVICDVLEHLENPQSALQEIYRILKKNGLVLISTPNPDSIGKKIQKKNWHGFRDKTHISISPLSQWCKFIYLANFTIIRSGTDLFWDIPYAVPIPKTIQKLLLIPFNITISRIMGFFPWYKGENLWFLIQKIKN